MDISVNMLSGQSLPTGCQSLGGLWCIAEKLPAMWQFPLYMMLIFGKYVFILPLVLVPAIIVRIIVKKFFSELSTDFIRITSLIFGSIIILPIIIYKSLSYSVPLITFLVVVVVIYAEYLVLLCIDKKKLKILLIGFLFIPLLFLILFGYLIY